MKRFDCFADRNDTDQTSGLSLKMAAKRDTIRLRRLKFEQRPEGETLTDSVIVHHANSTMTVTRRSIRSENGVYPIQNMAQFGRGSVPILHLRWSTIFWLAIITLIATPTMLGLGQFFESGGVRSVGVCLPLLWFCALIWKIINPKFNGLLLVLNSGDRELFVTTDLKGIADAVESLFSILENADSDNGDQCVINIDSSSVSGNIVIGSHTGSIASHTSSDPTVPPPSGGLSR